MKAVILVSPGTIEVRDVERPRPGPGQVLVKVHAAALNPTDLKHVDAFYKHVHFGNVSGCDYAGVVEELGPEVPHDLRRVGERVAGFVHGASSPNNGAYAEYCVADARLIFSLPDDLPFEDAAGLGVCSLTPCQMLWQSQGMPTPTNPATEDIPFLVWSGASAVGQYLIQLAHLSGLRVVTTASPKHTERLTALGASAVFDYRDPDVVAKIREATGGKLAHAGDCVADAESTAKVFACFGPDGGVDSIINTVDTSGLRTDVKTLRSAAYTLLGKDIQTPMPLKAIPEHYENGVKYCELITSLLAEGKLKTTPVKVFDGLDSMADCMDYMRSGKVSGEKVTCRIVRNG